MLHTGDFFGYHDFDKLFKEIEKSKSDISMCPKLGRHLLIKPKSQDRQRVRPAAQLLSSTTAHAGIRLLPSDQKMKRFSQFVIDIDSWFDSLNSYTKHHSHKPLKAGFRSMIYI